MVATDATLMRLRSNGGVYSLAKIVLSGIVADDLLLPDERERVCIATSSDTTV